VTLPVLVIMILRIVMVLMVVMHTCRHEQKPWVKSSI